MLRMTGAEQIPPAEVDSARMDKENRSTDNVSENGAQFILRFLKKSLPFSDILK